MTLTHSSMNDISSKLRSVICVTECIVGSYSSFFIHSFFPIHSSARRSLCGFKYGLNLLKLIVCLNRSFYRSIFFSSFVTSRSWNRFGFLSTSFDTFSGLKVTPSISRASCRSLVFSMLRDFLMPISTLLCSNPPSS